MKSWRQAIKGGLVPGVLGGAVTAATVAARGRRDTGSAVAPINATSHVLWGDEAAAVETVTVRHTVPAYLINTAAAIFWATVYEKLFGEAIDRRGASAALAGAAATAATAYVTDYKLVPRRFTPGYEKRLSARSLLMTFGALALSFTAGALLTRRRSPGE